MPHVGHYAYATVGDNVSTCMTVLQVAKQLFGGPNGLMIQLIHWFTKSPKRKETALLLDTLMVSMLSQPFIVLFCMQNTMRDE